MKMFEIVMSLAAGLGVLYMVVIEMLENCGHRAADTEHEARLHRQVAP